MGQLERYGLYVLVLVIFLILGVAIWGGDPQAVLASSASSAKIDPGTSLSTNVVEPEYRRVGTRSESFDDLFGDLVDTPAGDPVAAELASPSSTVLEDLQAADPEVQPLPIAVAAKPRSYRIRKSETLSDIAKRELGRASAWKEILDLNPGLDPKRLKIGQEIRLPGTAVQVAGFGGQRQHTVKPGEYLGSISQQYYDTARYANLIGEANNITDPRKIRAGKVLIIPAHPEKQ